MISINLYFVTTNLIKYPIYEDTVFSTLWPLMHRENFHMVLMSQIEFALYVSNPFTI